MKTKKIYLIRHGQTDFNLKGIVQGMGVNSSLNKTGKMQADAFFLSYGKKVRFDKIYVSELKRTEESVRKFIQLGVPFERHYGLNEINWGTHEGKEVTEEGSRYYNTVIDKWKQGETDLRIDGGESPQDVVNRLKPVMDHILSKEDEKTILIGHHGRAIRILMCMLLNYPLKYMDLFEHHNLGLYILNYTGSMFYIEKFNDTSHLDILKEL